MMFFSYFLFIGRFFVFLAHKVQCVFCGLEEMAAAPVDGPGADLVIHRRPNQDYTSCDHFLTSTAWLTLQGGKKPCRIALQFLVPCFGFAIAFGTNLRQNDGLGGDIWRGIGPVGFARRSANCEKHLEWVKQIEKGQGVWRRTISGAVAKPL